MSVEEPFNRLSKGEAGWASGWAARKKDPARAKSKSTRPTRTERRFSTTIKPPLNEPSRTFYGIVCKATSGHPTKRELAYAYGIRTNSFVVAGFRLRGLKPATTMFNTYEPNGIGMTCGANSTEQLRTQTRTGGCY